MAATAGEARKGIYRGFESTSRAGSRSISRWKKQGASADEDEKVRRESKEEEGEGERERVEK